MDEIQSRPVEYYRQFALMMAGASSVGERRRLWEEVSARQTGVPPVTRRRDEIGGVAVEWIASSSTDATAPILVFLHGGGFALGSIATHLPMIAHLAAATGCRVLAVDYRLFPEHPFPAQIEDAVAVYRGLLAEGAQARHVALVGDSAGGGLVVSSLLRARELGAPMPAAAVCIGPWVDLAVTGLSMVINAEVDPIIRGDSMCAGARNFLAGVSPYDPLASPIYADLSGLPPLLIQVGTTEALLDDARRLAGRAGFCGVDTTLREWPDMVHGWHQFAEYLPQARDALAEIHDFLNAQPGWTQTP